MYDGLGMPLYTVLIRFLVITPRPHHHRGAKAFSLRSLLRPGGDFTIGSCGKPLQNPQLRAFGKEMYGAVTHEEVRAAGMHTAEAAVVSGAFPDAMIGIDGKGQISATVAQQRWRTGRGPSGPERRQAVLVVAAKIVARQLANQQRVAQTIQTGGQRIRNVQPRQARGCKACAWWQRRW